MTTFALQRDRRQAAPDDFPHQLAELLAHLHGTMPADHPFARLHEGLPGRPERPEPFLLGSSPQSAAWAAELGLPYVFADFINPRGASITASYREAYEPSDAHPTPYTAVGVWALAAETGAEAERLASSVAMSMAMLRQGRLIPVPPPEVAVRYLAQHQGADAGRRSIVGDPATVRAGIEHVAAEYGAQEVVVVTITHDHAARRRSYESLADAFGLRPARPVAA